ncbi:MAG: HlyD family efflux transporter periplasmic adaptor subunit [Candidatus Rokubacteria bacterium]|nr:HlyD family efflux transporter periplasmic adaptor subunit [Candidatus Rokubacteria bacterium]
MTRRVLLLGVTAMVLVAVAFVASGALQRFRTEEPLALSGTIEGTQVDVSAKITGRIAELAAREGERVERGRVLARLAADELSAEARRAEGALAAARAQLRDLLAGARPEEIQEAEARAARAEAQLADLLAGARRQEIEQARAALRNAQVTREWTQRDFRRAEELYGKNLIAAQEVDRARQAFEVAAANEVGARERLDLVGVGPREHEVAAARADLRAARERVQLLRAGPRPDAVAAARAQITQAEAAITLARARLAEATIVSPIDGVVLRKNLEAGETANPGVAILTLLDPRDLWLRAYVPETDIGRVRVGQPASISVDAYPGRRFPGVISEIASEAEFTPKNVQTKKERVNLVFRVKIAAKSEGGVLKPGMPADAIIDLGGASRTPQAPHAPGRE